MAENQIPTLHHHLFIVRLWAETKATPEIQWRGSVEHIGSRQKRYFTSLSDLQVFIASQIDDAEQPTGKATSNG
ncbi:MAG: hypothetical protein ACOYYS_02935 [Chloroflexota bacterium]